MIVQLVRMNALVLFGRRDLVGYITLGAMMNKLDRIESIIICQCVVLQREHQCVITYGASHNI